MNELLEYYVSQCNRVLAGFILVPLLLGAGLFFTWRLRGIQVRMFFRSVREMFRGVKAEHEGDISPFQAFATGLASRVGTGNIVGVAVAIGLGGPGAIFWMWMTALVGMASSLVECGIRCPRSRAVCRAMSGEEIAGWVVRFSRSGIVSGWLVHDGPTKISRASGSRSKARCTR